MSLQSLLSKPLAAGSKYDLGHDGAVVFAALGAFDLQYGPALVQMLTGVGQTSLASDVTKMVGAATLAIAFISGLKRQFSPASPAAIDSRLRPNVDWWTYERSSVPTARW